MKPYNKLLAGILGMLLLALFSGMAVATEKETITGVITEKGLLAVDRGLIYDFSPSDKSDALKEMSGKKVTVTGTVSEAEGFDIINVINYKVIE